MKISRLATAVLIAFAAALPARADETCNSPYVTSLIKGQEDFVHVWTLGVAGLGDGNDKLVTIDANPRSARYGKVIHKISLPGRSEAHHMGFTDDRRFLWAGRLDDNKIFVFDMAQPQRPKLVRTISDLAAKTRFVGPHTFYALPGRMLVQALSNAKDQGGTTGIALFNNEGKIIDHYPMPTGEIGAAAAGRPIVTTWLNFLVGIICLSIALGINLSRQGSIGTLPTNIWVYIGGPCGLIFIAVASTVVKHLGVLNFILFSVTGQLIGALLLDWLLPTHKGALSSYLIFGTAMTLGSIAFSRYFQNPDREKPDIGFNRSL